MIKMNKGECSWFEYFIVLPQHNQLNTSLGYVFVGNKTMGSVSGINMTLVIF
jgi:hypothetical protein